jgi:hypothetical protein
MTLNKPTIAVDFDGVIHSRPKSERGGVDITGEPVPGAFNFLRHLTSAFEVVIFSSRFAGFDGQMAKDSVAKWMMERFGDDSYAQMARGKTGYDPHEILARIRLTATKPVARCYLDDRAITFKGIFPSIPDLLNFKTWEE